MHAEVIAIGSEILLGEIVDTNSSEIARRLRSIGLPVKYFSAVGDDQDRIMDVIRQGVSRSDVVITTGGIGPTIDDLTREAVARVSGKPLVLDEVLLEQIEERFRRWGRQMTANNRRQAWRPEGSIAVENPVGTAPSFIIELNGSAIVCLPGVPREMEFLMDRSVLPFLRRRFGQTGIIKCRDLKVSGLGESLVDERIGDLETLENPTVGLNAHSGVIVIRLTARAPDEEKADRLLAPVEYMIRERLGDSVFGADSDTLESVVLAELEQRGQTLAVLEWGTGGRLAGKLAEAEPRSAAFAGCRIVKAGDSSDLISLARHAAHEAQAAWGLACAVSRENDEILLDVGVWNLEYEEEMRRGFGSHPKLAPEWASNTALDFLRKILLAATRKK